MAELEQSQIQEFADQMMASSGHKEIPTTFKSPLGRDNPEEVSISQDGDFQATQDKGETGNDQEDRAPQPSPDTEQKASSSEKETPPDPTTKPGEPNLSYEQQRKSEYYDLLMRNPRTRDAIETALASEFGEVPNRPSTPQKGNQTPNSNPEGYVTREEFEELQNRSARLAAAYSNMVVENMATKYPDFKSLINDMAPIARANPNLSPEQLYHLAKSAKGGNSVVGERKSTPSPTEVGPGGGGSRTSEASDPVAAAVEKARRLPQGPRRTEDALRLIYQAALESEGNA